MTTDTEEINITQENIKHMAEDADIDERYLRNAMENEKADQRYERCQDKYDNNEYNNKQDISDIKKAMKFLGTTIYSVPTIPNFATVVDIKAPDDEDIIIIKTESRYPTSDMTDINKENYENKHTFDLSKSHDRIVFDNILGSVNANDPSELVDEKIPIRPYQDSTGSEEKPNFDYSLDVIKPNMTLYKRSTRKLIRLLMKLNCIERTTKYWGGHDSKGNFVINKNISLYIVLTLNLINYTLSSNMFNVITLFMTGIFVTYLLLYIGIGLNELFTQKQENREFVNLRVNK